MITKPTPRERKILKAVKRAGTRKRKMLRVMDRFGPQKVIETLVKFGILFE